MARLKPAPGEKPLFWIASAKSELLEFPEPVKDEIGVALSVAQFGRKHRKRSLGKERVQAFWKSWRITGATLTG